MKKSLLFAFLFVSITLFSMSFILAQEEVINESSSGNILLKNIIPKEFKTGDAQFSIQIKNNQDANLTDVVALVTGKGFSTYDVVPIEILESRDVGYILVLGNFKEAGNITLTIRINQELFYQNITVLDSSNNSIIDELIKEQEEKKRILEELTVELEDIKNNFSNLENELNDKKERDYDVSQINLEDLRKYIRDAQSNIFGEDVDNARINLELAMEEYQYQKNKLENVKKIPVISRLKDFALIFSTIAGAIITFFALSELLKRKKEHITTKIKGKKK